MRVGNDSETFVENTVTDAEVFDWFGVTVVVGFGGMELLPGIDGDIVTVVSWQPLWAITMRAVFAAIHHTLGITKNIGPCARRRLSQLRCI